jgi:hypothetical protein
MKFRKSEFSLTADELIIMLPFRMIRAYEFPDVKHRSSI